jgi:hypothetical protein
MNENKRLYSQEDLIEARQSLGLSRRAACEITQVPYAVWTEWEKGCGYGTPPQLVFACLNLYDNLLRTQQAIMRRDLQAIVHPCLSCKFERAKLG